MLSFKTGLDHCAKKIAFWSPALPGLRMIIGPDQRLDFQ